MDYQARIWDGKNRFTVVVLQTEENNEGITILSVDPETKEAVELILPSDMEITTVAGRGKWRIGSVVQLGKKYGQTWAADSIADYLGISYTTIKNNMDIWDKISWWNLTRGIEWQTIDLNGTKMVSQQEAPDGESVSGVTSWWQSRAGDWFFSTNIAKEGLNVEIYNTTGIAGLATRAARILDKAGVKVVKLGDNDVKVEKCVVKTFPAMTFNTGVKWIGRNFNCEIKEDSSLDAKQVQIYIGSNYLRWLIGEGGEEN